MKTKKQPKKSKQRLEEDQALYERAMQSGMEAGRQQAISVLLNSAFALFNMGGHDAEAHQLRDYALKIRAMGAPQTDALCHTHAPQEAQP